MSSDEADTRRSSEASQRPKRISPGPDLPIFQRRSARLMACANGLIWGVGNGLTSTALVVYLADTLGAPRLGLGVGMILAARHLAGVLRLGAPLAIGRVSPRKNFCLASYTLSALCLLALPVASAPGVLPSPGASLAALVLLWCLYHVLEYLGNVALYSWMADLVPLRIRGRFFGRRERWMLLGIAPAMLAAGTFSYWWNSSLPKTQQWSGYAIPAAVGACAMLAAVLPLARIPRLETSPAIRHGVALRQMLLPLADARFAGLVLFGCLFSLTNGLTQATQNLFPVRVLGISLLMVLAAQVALRMGQLAISPTIGRLADRIGNRPVMVASQLIGAAGLLFYALATSQQWQWFFGAWAAWIAYAGMNVCLPNLLLKLAPTDCNTPHLALYYTLTGLCYAATTIGSGQALDMMYDITIRLGPELLALDYYRFSFVLGWLLRSLVAVCLLVLVKESASSR